MPGSHGTDTQIQNLIDLSLQGDAGAKEALLQHACDRLLRMTRRTFRNYPYLRRWEATDDVFQNAMVRFHRALREVRVESVRHFFNLAGLQISNIILRREDYRRAWRTDRHGLYGRGRIRPAGQHGRRTLVGGYL